MEVNLVCPGCEAQNLHQLDTTGWHHLECSECQTVFDTYFGTVRAKRSRGHKGSNSRQYSIRSFDDNGEELLEFGSNIYEDAELRAKDAFALSKVNDVVKVVQNLNVRKYWVVNVEVENNEPSTAPVIIGILFLIVVFMVIGAS